MKKAPSRPAPPLRQWLRQWSVAAISVALATVGLPMAVWAQAFPNAAIPGEPIPTSAGVGTVPDANYLLGPGDQLGLSILGNKLNYGFSEEDNINEFPVLADGTVNLPLVGPVKVAGLTMAEANQRIRAAYSSFIRRPAVVVLLTKIRALQITIAGEVSRPGVYRLETGERGDRAVTVTDLISAAGGITPSADLRHVVLRRQRSQQPDELVRLDLWQLLQEGNSQQNVRLQDGDSVFIPTATTYHREEVQQLSEASFAAPRPERINVTVVGEVYRAGPQIVEGGAPGGFTVTQAIRTAGGIKAMADIRNIVVQRPTRNAGVQLIAVDLWKLIEDGSSNQDILLHQGDTVIIPTAEAIPPEEVTRLATTSFSPERITVNVVGEVRRPGVIQVQPDTTLNNAILAAGGFTPNRANRNVEFLRLNPDGTVTRRKIKVDFAQNIDPENNPVLRNNDVVVVGRSGLAQFSDGFNAVAGPFFQTLSLFNFLNLFLDE